MCRGRETGAWDLTLPLVDNAVNRSIGRSPFEVVYGYSPCTPADFIPLPPDNRVTTCFHICIVYS